MGKDRETVPPAKKSCASLLSTRLSQTFVINIIKLFDYKWCNRKDKAHKLTTDVILLSDHPLCVQEGVLEHISGRFHPISSALPDRETKTKGMK